MLSDIASGLDLSSCKIWTETTEDNVTYAKEAVAYTHKHSYGEEWKTDKISRWHECGYGEKTDEAEHIEDGGTVTKAPTEQKKG